MKKLVLFSSIIAASATAQAGSLSLDLRADMNSTNYNEKAELGNAGISDDTSDFTKFYIQTGRLDYKGKLNDDTSFRLRWRFAGKDQGAMSKRDSANSTLDYAYVDHKISDMFSITAGKISGAVGAFEGSTSGADMYFTSEAYNGTSFLNSGTRLVGFTNNLYTTGVQGTFSMAGQDLMVQSTNSDNSIGRSSSVGNGDVLENSKLSQNKTMTGVIYKGAFLEKTLNVILSNHFQNFNSDTKTDLTAFGLQYKTEELTAMVEYFVNKYKSLSGTSTLNDQLTSTVVTVKYTLGQWTPVLKFSSSEEKLDGTTEVKNKYTSYGAAVEFKPKAEDNFRYHIAYNSRTMKPDGSDDKSMQEVMVGMKILADFLK